MAANKSDIWKTAISLTGLVAGWNKVRRNNGAAGGDGLTIPVYSRNSAKRLSELASHMENGTYERGEYRKLHIPKRKGGLRRLMIPSLEDRIIHTALAQTLSPVLEPMFENSSFAYRPGRSVRQAVAAIEKWRNEGYEHVIEADIISYFDAIRHQDLLRSLRTHLPASADTTKLLEFLTKEFEHQGSHLGFDGRGLVQGSPLSPLLANLYLDHLDEEFHRKGVRIVRFADDFVILCKRRKSAEAVLEEVEQVLMSLGLELHQEKTRLIDFDKGFEFLGYLFVRSLAMKKRRDDWNAVTQKSKALPSKSPLLPEASVAQLNEPAEPAIDLMDEPVAASDHALGDRVLYVMERGRHLEIGSSAYIVLDKSGIELAQIGRHRIDRIEIGPSIHLAPDVIHHCIANKVPLTFVDGWGMPRAQLSEPNCSDASLQMAQAAFCLNDQSSCQIASSLVNARIRNQRTQLFRLNRHKENHKVNEALQRMGRHLRKLQPDMKVNKLRGLEGASAAEYWKALAILATGVETPFKRSRPAADPFNAALNYLTALLQRDIRSAVIRAGQHPGFGTLHVSRDYADAAVYDLMEPFRAPLTEGLASFLFNSRRLKVEMFDVEQEGLVRISPLARKAIISGYEQYVAKRVKLNGSNRKFGWRMIMRRQAYDLAKAYRKKDVTQFQPYLMEA